MQLRARSQGKLLNTFTIQDRIGNGSGRTYCRLGHDQASHNNSFSADTDPLIYGQSKANAVPSYLLNNRQFISKNVFNWKDFHGHVRHIRSAPPQGVRRVFRLALRRNQLGLSPQPPYVYGAPYITHRFVTQPSRHVSPWHINAIVNQSDK